MLISTPGSNSTLTLVSTTNEPLLECTHRPVLDHDGLMSEPSSLHKYLYTADDPVDRVDPSGRVGEEITGVLTVAPQVLNIETERAQQDLIISKIILASILGLGLFSGAALITVIAMSMQRHRKHRSWTP